MILAIYKFILRLYTIIYCKLKGHITVSSRSIIYPTSRISMKDKTGGVSVGSNSNIGRRTVLGHYYPTKIRLEAKDAKVIIGSNVNLNGVNISCCKFISIGNNCRIASGVVILDYNGHIVNSSDRTVGRDCPKCIIIGNNVWIGINSIILKGTSIGDNSVVGAGSIVKGQYPPNSIICGNPAKIVGVTKAN